MKLPAFQFYPADWRKDLGVQALSFRERGVWFELLCLMHESEERGVLIMSKKPMSHEVIARLIGLKTGEFEKIIRRILALGVASKQRNGAIYCRRMVRDEKLRKVKRDAGLRGGNPVLLKQNINHRVNHTGKHQDNYQVKQKGGSSASASASSSASAEEDISPPAGGGILKDSIESENGINPFFQQLRDQAKDQEERGGD